MRGRGQRRTQPKALAPLTAMQALDAELACCEDLFVLAAVTPTTTWRRVMTGGG